MGLTCFCMPPENTHRQLLFSTVFSRISVKYIAFKMEIVPFSWSRGKEELFATQNNKDNVSLPGKGWSGLLAAPL